MNSKNNNKLDYFYGQESEQFTFYRIPKILFTDPFLRQMSTDAKLLYGLMLDRMQLSMKNQWMDEQKRVYIIYTFSQAGTCSPEAMTSIMEETKKAEKGEIVFKKADLQKYFPGSFTPKQMEETIVKLLDQWQRKKQREQSL